MVRCLRSPQGCTVMAEFPASSCEARMVRRGGDGAGEGAGARAQLLPVRLLGGSGGVFEITMTGGVLVRVDREILDKAHDFSQPN